MLACKFWPIFQGLKSHNFVTACSIEYYKSWLINGYIIQLNFGVQQLKIGKTIVTLHSFAWNVKYTNIEGFHRDYHIYQYCKYWNT